MLGRIQALDHAEEHGKKQLDSEHLCWSLCCHLQPESSRRSVRNVRKLGLGADRADHSQKNIMHLTPNDLFAWQYIQSLQSQVQKVYAK